MLINNLRDGYFYQYDIMFDGKDWYAWFLKEQNVVDAMKEELNK